MALRATAEKEVLAAWNAATAAGKKNITGKWLLGRKIAGQEQVADSPATPAPVLREEIDLRPRQHLPPGDWLGDSSDEEAEEVPPRYAVKRRRGQNSD